MSAASIIGSIINLAPCHACYFPSSGSIVPPKLVALHATFCSLLRLRRHSDKAGEVLDIRINGGQPAVSTVPGQSGYEVASGTQNNISMNIKIDDLSGSEIHELLQEHLQSMRLHSPPESVHALDIEALRAPEITFWTVWENGELLGCGALKELDSRHAEIKSMRTSSAHLRKGVATYLLNHVLKEAERRGYTRLSLETGSMEAFDPARKLYANFGFEYCEPFADYVEDPNSVFMTREL